jgi:hypothetical protein
VYDLITITPLVAIGGQCNYCKLDLDETCILYPGRVFEFTCDGCGHDYELTLKEGN